MKLTDEQVDELKELKTADEINYYLDTVKGEDMEELTKEMRNHFMVMIGNKLCIVSRDNFNKRISKNDFISFYSNVTEEIVQVLNTKNNKQIESIVSIKLAPIFIDEDIERYNSIVFRPATKVKNNVYNIWHGWNVQPVEGNCNGFLKHLREIICSNDKVLEEYILNWLAQLIQRPEEKKYIPALVLRGAPGTGKGTFVSYLELLLKDYFAHLTSREPLVTNFNTDLAYKMLVFADEVTWAGGHVEASKLKTFISENTHRIELKNKDAEYQENWARLIIASNSDWVAPVEKGDRRYVVMDVDPKMQGDVKYFENLIVNEAKKGGAEALLYLLKNRDISKVNWDDKPNTSARDDQKILSLPPIESWVLHQLNIGSEGIIIPGKKLMTNEAYESFTAWMRVYKSWANIPSLTMFTRKLGNLFDTKSIQSNGISYRNLPIDLIERFKKSIEVDDIFAGLR